MEPRQASIVRGLPPRPLGPYAEELCRILFSFWTQVKTVKTGSHMKPSAKFIAILFLCVFDAEAAHPVLRSRYRSLR